MQKLFVTQVYRAKLPFDLKGLKTEALQIQKSDSSGRQWSEINYPAGFTSYGSMDQLHKFSSNINDLRRKLDVHVEKFAKSLQYDIKRNDLRLNTIWVNVMGPGAQHTAHIHPHSVISGTYYVQTPADCSSIKFEDPRLGLFMNTPEVKSNANLEQKRFVSLQPKAGEVILFESWLKHEVPRNTSKTPRISISFNYGWNRG